MADSQPTTAQEAFIALLEESAKQTALLNALLNSQLHPQWEYLVVQIQQQKERWYEYYGNGEKMEGMENKAVFVVLSELGAQGWELVHVMTSGDLFMKRRKR